MSIWSIFDAQQVFLCTQAHENLSFTFVQIIGWPKWQRGGEEEAANDE